MTTGQPIRPEIASDIQRWLDRLAGDRQRPVLIVVGQLNEEVVSVLRLYCWTSLQAYNEVSVLLHSYGGYAESAYRMLLTLRRYAHDIEVLVPQEAKSAATLFCLGADQIHIGYGGELGPLDTQLVDRNGNSHSALESFKASEQLLEHAMLALSRITETIRPIRRLVGRRSSYNVRFDLANSLMDSLVTNLYTGFDESELGKNSMSLSEVEEYAVRAILRSSQATDKRKEDICKIAHKLVWEYPSHDFLIDLEEAQNLGLNVSLMDDFKGIQYIIMLNDIISNTGAEGLNELMSGEVSTFFGIGFPDVSTEQNDSIEKSSEPEMDDDDVNRNDNATHNGNAM